MQITVESEIKQKASQSTLIDALIRFSSKRNEENAREFASACASADYRFSQSPRTYNQSIVPL